MQIDPWLRFFSELRTPLSREQVAALYGARGWCVRKCSWTDYEVLRDWGDLVIESESPLLMHGRVADIGKAEELVSPLRDAGIMFTAKWYAEDQKLLLELRSLGTRDATFARDPPPRDRPV